MKKPENQAIIFGLRKLFVLILVLPAVPIIVLTAVVSNFAHETNFVSKLQIIVY